MLFLLSWTTPQCRLSAIVVCPMSSGIGFGFAAELSEASGAERAVSNGAVQFKVFEGPHRLGDETLGGVAHFAVTEGHRARPVECLRRHDESGAGIGRLQETGFHLHGHAAAGGGVQGPACDRHRHVEQRHEHAAMSDGPAVQMTRSEIECDHRAAVLSTDEFNAKILDERDVISKCDGLAHWRWTHSILCMADSMRSNRPGKAGGPSRQRLQKVRMGVDGGISYCAE